MEYIIVVLLVVLVVRGIRNDRADGRSTLTGGRSGGGDDPPVSHK